MNQILFFKKGKLSQLYLTKEDVQNRREVLDKAIKQSDITSIARKLTAVVTLQKNTNPHASLEKDADG